MLQIGVIWGFQTLHIQQLVIFRCLCYSTVTCLNSVSRGNSEWDKEEEILIRLRHVTNRIINSMSILRINHRHLQAVRTCMSLISLSKNASFHSFQNLVMSNMQSCQFTCWFVCNLASHMKAGAFNTRPAGRMPPSDAFCKTRAYFYNILLFCVLINSYLLH